MKLWKWNEGRSRNGSNLTTVLLKKKGLTVSSLLYVIILKRINILNVLTGSSFISKWSSAMVYMVVLHYLLASASHHPNVSLNQ